MENYIQEIDCYEGIPVFCRSTGEACMLRICKTSSTIDCYDVCITLSSDEAVRHHYCLSYEEVISILKCEYEIDDTSNYRMDWIENVSY